MLKKKYCMWYTIKEVTTKMLSNQKKEFRGPGRYLTQNPPYR